MKIAILGTRGIPNNYGGFEQCAEFLAEGLVERGHSVTVYNTHKHPYKAKSWKGVEIIHRYDPEDSIGAAGQFIYDLNCIIDARKKNYDIILQLGYSSNSVWGWLLPKGKTVVTTNMDGLEWKRTKFSLKVRKFLKFAESLAVRYSDFIIADSLGIKDYLKQTYNKDSVYIPYGANLFNEPNETVLNEFNVTPYQYNLLIARLEPENSIEIILDGVVSSGKTDDFLVIGMHDTELAKRLKEKLSAYKFIRFIGGVYDMSKLNSLRYYSNIYFHGHTVGGTNPSLLEAMASNSLICANNNSFNRYILGDDAYYFLTAEDVADVMRSVKKQSEGENPKFIANNNDKIVNTYSWTSIIDQYERHFKMIAK